MSVSRFKSAFYIHEKYIYDWSKTARALHIVIDMATADALHITHDALQLLRNKHKIKQEMRLVKCVNKFIKFKWIVENIVSASFVCKLHCRWHMNAVLYVFISSLIRSLIHLHVFSSFDKFPIIDSFIIHLVLLIFILLLIFHFYPFFPIFFF